MRDDRMPEGEVALILAEYLLQQPGSSGRAEVAIDGASVIAHGNSIFDVVGFLQARNWRQITSDEGRNSWTGEYERGDHIIRVHSKSGVGDVETLIMGRRIVAECKKGPLVKKAGSPERPLLSTALGQALIVQLDPSDIVVAAVPNSEAFARIAEVWRNRPLVRRAGIQIALVDRNGHVSGLSLSSGEKST